MRSGDDMKWYHKTWLRVGDPEKPMVMVFSAVYTCFPLSPLRWVETLLPCCCCLMLTDVTWSEHHDGLSLHWLRVSRLPGPWLLLSELHKPMCMLEEIGCAEGAFHVTEGEGPALQVDPIKWPLP